MSGYSLNCLTGSVVKDSIKKTIIDRNVTQSENLVLEDKNRIFPIKQYNYIFYKFLFMNDIDVLYEGGISILRRIIIMKRNLSQESDNDNDHEDWCLDSRDIYSTEKTHLFQNWVNQNYQICITPKIYEILNVQLELLSFNISEVREYDFKNYISMFISVTLNIKTLELLVKLYGVLQTLGQEDILLNEYYKDVASHNNSIAIADYIEEENHIVSEGPDIDNNNAIQNNLSQMSFIIVDRNTHSTNDQGSWYKRIYHWIMHCIQNIMNIV